MNSNQSQPHNGLVFFQYSGIQQINGPIRQKDSKAQDKNH
jgi:hypothetical protein